MSEIQAKVEEAGKKFKEVVETLGKNYLGAVVAGAFTPVLEDGINAFLEEAKAAAGKGGSGDDGDIKGLAEDPEEKAKDTILVAVDSLKPITTRYNQKFMAYSTFTIRIGNVGEEKAKKFYVNAKHYDIRYTQLRRAPELAKEDFKTLNPPAFPAKYEFGGTYCICLTKAPGDSTAHLKAVQDYFPTLTKSLPGYSDSVASLFKIGNDWEKQQLVHDIFVEAYNGTMSDLGLSSLNRELVPYTEVEALVMLLQAVADRDVLPGLLGGIEQQFLKDQAQDAILKAVDTAANGWAPLSKAAGEASAKVVAKVQEGAEKLLEALSPVLKKTLELINEKMAEKADSKEEEDVKEDTSVQVGQIAAQWQFQQTTIGKAFHESLAAKKASEAIGESTDAIKKALDDGIRGPLTKLSDSLLGSGKGPVKKIVAREINKITNTITGLILEVTTLDGFLAAGKVLGEVVDEVEKKLGDKDAADHASEALFKGLASISMELWQRIFALKEKVEGKLSGQPGEAVDAVIGLLEHIFEVQVRAFNSIRIQYVRNLTATLGDAKDKTEASRLALRTAIFSTIDLLGAHHFVKAYETLTTVAKIIIINWVQQNVWPPVKSGLEAIQSLIPSEIADLGLKIEPLAWKLVTLLINNGVGWALKQVFLAIERAVFTQKAEGGY